MRASSKTVREQLAGLHPDALPTPNIAAAFAENMKFSDCRPETLDLEVARPRLIIDPEGVKRVLDEVSGDAYG